MEKEVLPLARAAEAVVSDPKGVVPYEGASTTATSALVSAGAP
jgi:hypothetical protein